MKRTVTLAATVAAVALTLSVGTGCQKLKARDHLNKGVQAYKSAKYAEAVEHFRESINLDPSFPTARLYLATAYMNQWIPGADSPENKRYADQAKGEFMRVLENNPKDSVALASIASIEYNTAKALPQVEDKLRQLQEAEKAYEKLAEADPNNKEAHYSLGVIAWEDAYAQILQARSKMGMKQSDPGPLKDKKVREELKAKLMPELNAGIQHINRALEIDPEYHEAMAYINLLLRSRADLQDTPELARKDVETAEGWVQKALETQKIKAAREAEKNQGGIVMETK